MNFWGCVLVCFFQLGASYPDVFRVQNHHAGQLAFVPLSISIGFLKKKKKKSLLKKIPESQFCQDKVVSFLPDPSS